MLSDIQLLGGWCKINDIDLEFTLADNAVDFYGGSMSVMQCWNVFIRRNGSHLFIDGYPITQTYPDPEIAARDIINKSLGKKWTTEPYLTGSITAFKFPDSREELQFELDKRGIRYE